jgi:hypothetical protein
LDVFEHSVEGVAVAFPNDTGVNATSIFGEEGSGLGDDSDATLWREVFVEGVTQVFAYLK